MRILITGGAGYLGSHCTRKLLDQGHSVTVFDNLSTGQKKSIDSRARLISASLQNYEVLSQTLRTFSIEAVVHFAGACKVSESLVDPAKYYQNNLCGTLNLLCAMRSSNVKKIIYSSSSAVYGEPQFLPVTELHPKTPITPYSRSLSMAEDIIFDFSHSYGINYCILRYLNVAGTDKDFPYDQGCSEQLIPQIITACLNPHHDFKVYGLDYPTEDGTYVRDYIHITDLTEAISLVLNSCERNPNQIYNLGTLKQYSVLEVLKACENITKVRLNVVPAERRVGDSAMLTLNSEKIRQQLGWSPRFESIEDIIRDIWTSTSQNSFSSQLSDRFF